MSSSPAFLSRPVLSVPCLSPTRSFSPIKQYLYANHVGLIATALHAWVIRVTIIVSRSPMVSFRGHRDSPPTSRRVSRRLRYRARGTQWISYREASRHTIVCGTGGILARGLTTARDTHRRYVLIIHLSVFCARCTETRVLRRVIIAIMRLQELVTRIVRDLISRRTRKRQANGIYSSKPSISRESARFGAKREKG